LASIFPIPLENAGFDISCGVRTLHTGLSGEVTQSVQGQLADTLFRTVPAGHGRKRLVHLDLQGMEAMLSGDAR
jgi:tRNA-splicing ligase RtcB (3'-phosphate/5'-hydroxy nucleic acid ligase)